MSLLQDNERDKENGLMNQQNTTNESLAVPQERKGEKYRDADSHLLCPRCMSSNITKVDKELICNACGNNQFSYSYEDKNTTKRWDSR